MCKSQYVYNNVIYADQRAALLARFMLARCDNNQVRYGLPRPQVSLLGRARFALGYGIDSVWFARRCGIDANKPSSLEPPVFPPYRILPKSAFGGGRDIVVLSILH